MLRGGRDDYKNMEGGCEYTEWAFAGSRQGAVLQPGSWSRSQQPLNVIS